MRGRYEPVPVDAMRDGYIVGQNRFAPNLFHRYPGNPILSAADWPYAAHTVFNPGATQLPSGETLLLVRVEDRRGISHLTAARSSDGITDWRIDAQPTFSCGTRGLPGGTVGCGRRTHRASRGRWAASR